MMETKSAADAPLNIEPGDQGQPNSQPNQTLLPDANRDDVVRLYNFFLRREPESDQILSSRIGIPIASLMADFVHAEEFQRRVGASLTARPNGPREYVFGRPRLDLVDWATTRLGLPPQTAKEISTARTWAHIDIALLRDETIWSAIAPNLKEEISPALSECLRLLELGDHSLDISGCLDLATPDLIAGWCCDCGDLKNKMWVELYAENELLGKAPSSMMRTDLVDLIGGDGRFGFSFRTPATKRSLFENDIWVIAREATSRRLLGKLLCRKKEGSARASSADGGNLKEPLTRVDERKKVASYDDQHRAISKPRLFVEASTKLPDGNFTKPEFATVVEKISRSGLFDASYYEERNNGSISPDLSSLQHYLSVGEALGLRPNPYFCPHWYTQRYRPDCSPQGALLHYIEEGENVGNRPCSVFETAWYLNAYLSGKPNISPLFHYLNQRHSNLFNPNRFFEIDKYLEDNSDVKASKVDGFWHWMNFGIFENRSASSVFDANFVWRQYLGNNRNLNAFEIFMDVGVQFNWEATPGATSSGTTFLTVHRQVAANIASGPLFEDLGPRVDTADQVPKIVALYLPQFHAIPENDRWWGAGFTEWHNIARGVPRFEGHIQPHIPRDLGFYTLEGTSTLRRQIELARHSGVHGFCFYYYNFNGHRLLERPLEAFLDDKQIDFPFCIMWANENWSRRWDGSEKEVLIRQDYFREDLPELIDDIARHMKDPRYMRNAEGRPLFFIYRADVISDAQDTIADWRDRFRSVHGLNPLIIMSQSFGVHDPRPFGFDGAIEFPPHKLAAALPLLNPSLRIWDPDFSGVVRDYAGVVRESLAVSTPAYPIIKTAIPSWDNDARRQGKGMVIANSTPRAFEDWMRSLLRNSATNKFHGESLVFVNAWNEWCEGAYLEPDTHFGFAYLNALGRALKSLQPDLRRIVLIGHDAFPSGAQHLLLHIGETFARNFGMDVRFILIEGGEMAPRYRDIADTFVASEFGDSWEALRIHLTDLCAEGFSCALTNTTASGGVCTILDDLGFSFCSLVHELPTFVRGAALEPTYSEISQRAGAVIYPSHYVKLALDRAFGEAQRKTIVLPQGLYHQPHIPERARASVRQEFDLADDDKIVLNVGYADLRKGVDLFVSLAEQVALLDRRAHFVWVGGVHPDIRPWLELDLMQRGLSNVHFAAFTLDIGRYLGAADLFLLTSREDPFPSVVLEALAAGLPVAAFENSGGHVELLKSDGRLGELLPFGSGPDCARRIVERLSSPRDHEEWRRRYVSENFDFTEYCSSLLRSAAPNYHTVSVIVPNYNYALYLRERLLSIFSQTYPVFEIIVLDDASDDESVAVAEQVAQEAGRVINLVRREANSGNVFRQWKEGLDRARGEFIWIAEADDSSDPNFLPEVMRTLTDDPDAAFCFADSRAINPDGSVLYESYKGYYREFGDTGLDQSGRFAGSEFLRRFLTVRNLMLNVSSVVWRKDVLVEAFANLGQEAFKLSCAGDWRIYLEVTRRAKAVRYIAATMNRHRRHENSVTQRLSKKTHFEEIAHVQGIALNIAGNEADLRNQVMALREKLQGAWEVESVPFDSPKEAS
jgi:glycosyltransferase involved in cell wall biosynthesis